MKKQYKITTLSDISQVPRESLDDLLIDLKSCLALRQVVVDVNEMFEVEAIEVPESMNWIDDGGHDINLSITIKGE